MSFNSTTLLKLAALKLDPEQMAGVVEILADYEAAEEARKVAQRDRARKSRASRDRNAIATSVERDVPRAGVTRVEDKTQTTVIEPQKKQTHSTDVEAFKAALSGVCDPERVEAIIKHRRTKRGQITGLAAKLFIRDAEACGLSVPQAVDTCISRNWITVNADWLKDRNQARGSPPPKPIDILNAAINRMDLADADPPEEAPRNPAPAQLIPFRQSG